MRIKLATLDFETKRLALDMLSIKVWLDGHDVEITGTLQITDDAIVTTQSALHSHNNTFPFRLKISAGVAK